MSRTFATGDHIYTGSNAGVTSFPLTLSCWFYRTGAGSLYMMSLDKISAVQIHGMYSNTTELDAWSDVAGGVSIAIKTTVSNNTWMHGAAVFASATSRISYLNGVAGTPQTTSRIPTGMDNFHLGAVWLTTRTANWAGQLAETAMWDVVLTDPEIVGLSKGFSPRRIRPQSLKEYLPLVRELTSRKNSLTATASGTTITPHPRIYA